MSGSVGLSGQEGQMLDGKLDATFSGREIKGEVKARSAENTVNGNIQI